MASQVNEESLAEMGIRQDGDNKIDRSGEESKEKPSVAATPPPREGFSREIPRRQSIRGTPSKFDGKYPHDTYSFIALNGPKNNWLWADRKRFLFFLFGLLPFVFQMTFLMLLVWSQTDELRGTIAETDNPDKEKDGTMAILADFIPANANPIVRTAQIMSIASYVIFADGSLQDILRAVQCFPYAKVNDGDPVRCMRLSCILRGIQGILAMFVVLLLIITSSTVVDLLLNFTAVNFISEIDDYAFELALSGEFNEALEDEAERITKEDLPPCLFKNTSSRNSCKFIVSCLVSLILFGMMAFVSASQDSLNFWVTKTLRVEFKESTGLNPYSGCFFMNKQSNAIHFSRRTYHSHATGTSNSSIGYCRQDRQWILHRGSASDPCDAASNSELLLARSPKTDTFDISTSFDRSWFSASNTPLNLYFFDSNGNETEIEEHCDSFLGDGNCDSFFNELGYDFDGGDCCAATCSQTTCGRGGLTSVFGDLTASGDGFENCVDPTMFPITIHLNDIASNRDPKFTGFEKYTDADKDDRPWGYDEGKFEQWKETPPVSPYFALECNGKNVMTAYIEESMVGKSQTVKVEDGATCTLVIRNTTTDINVFTDEPIWLVDYSLFHERVNGDPDARVEILSNSSFEVETVTFRRIPECYCRKLQNHTELNSIYTDSGKANSNKAIDWLLADDTGHSECEDYNFLERYALMNMYFAMDAPAGFSSEEEQCTWPSISCSEGNVAKIQLRDAGVGGDIPSELSLLSSLEGLQMMSCNQVPSLAETSVEDQLIYLDVSKSSIACYSIPTELWNLSSLQVLRLNENFIYSLPTEIGSLSNLQWLSLDDNVLSSLPTEIGSLSSLKELYLGFNELDYMPTQIGSLSSLEQVALDWNALSSLPTEMGRLSRLQRMDLGSNSLLSLPTEIGRLSSLQELYLDWNELSSLPTEIGNLSNLQHLDLNDNSLWSLPTEVTKLSSLLRLNLGFNSFGYLPTEIANLSSLEVLDLSFAGLTSLLTEIGQLSNLQVLYLEEQSSLTSLPTEIGNLSNLQQLIMNDNSLWSLPTEVTKLSSLLRLNLDGNELWSVPTEIASLSNLQELRVARNYFTSLPPELGSLSTLQTLSLSYNMLTNLTEIWNLSNLQELFLTKIGLIDLPTEIGSLSSLQVLSLSTNELANLPTEIGYLSRLERLDLDGNQLTSIPREIENLSNLKELYLGYNNFNFTCDDLPEGLANLCISTSCYLYSSWKSPACFQDGSEDDSAD